MKIPSSKIPSGRVTAPTPTAPALSHGNLAKIFTALASHHAALAANKPDRAIQPLMRPDKVARAQAAGQPGFYAPTLGTPNAADPME
jgi:hypothetical protein